MTAALESIERAFRTYMEWDAEALARQGKPPLEEACIAQFLLSAYPPLEGGNEAAWRGFLKGEGKRWTAASEAVEAALARAPQSEPRMGESAKKAASPATTGRDALIQYIDLKFTLYAQVEEQDGRRFADWRTGKWSKQPQSAIRTIEELDAALKRGICLFSFLPSERGYVCLDFDIGHSSGKNGFLSWRSLLAELRFSHNPLKGTVWVKTPSGGRHYYFLHRATIGKYKAEPVAGVDAFGAGIGKTLQAAGSVRKGKAYELHGKLSDAARLPLSLVCCLAEREESMDAWKAEQAARLANQRGTPSRRGGRRQKCETAEDRRSLYTADQCVEFGARNAEKAGYGGSRANCAFFVGKSSGYAYPLEELKAACWRHPAFANREDFSERELEYQLRRGIAESKYK